MAKTCRKFQIAASSIQLEKCSLLWFSQPHNWADSSLCFRQFYVVKIQTLFSTTHVGCSRLFILPERTIIHVMVWDCVNKTDLRFSANRHKISGFTTIVAGEIPIPRVKHRKGRIHLLVLLVSWPSLPILSSSSSVSTTRLRWLSIIITCMAWSSINKPDCSHICYYCCSVDLPSVV
jgi:hypothetical protein